MAALALVAGFGALALVAAGPVTPIKFDLARVTGLLNPYFSQNWSLFAPDPISEERGVLAQVRCRDKTSAWTDITTRPVQQVQSSRLFPSRESRIISNGLVARFFQDDVSRRLAESGHRAPSAEEQRASAHAELTIARYAALEIPCQHGRRADAVRLRYVFHKFPGWSHRLELDARGGTKVLDSSWVSL